MAEAIRMPLLSDTMKEGVIAAWHKKVGDTVKSDDVIADVETDKATMEVMPYVDGTLLYIGVEQGKAVPVNGIMAIIGKPGEDYKPLLESGAAAPAAQPEQKAEQPAPQPAQQPAPQTAPPTNQPGNQSTNQLPKDATVVRMPLLSDTMTEGKIVAWHKKVGDTVKSDDVLADVETDKATMEVMGYADGTLLYIGVKEGEAAKINDIIAIIGKAGTDVQAFVDAEKSGKGGGGQQQAPAQPQGAGAPQQPGMPAQPEPQPSEAHNEDERVKASPLARKLAADKGIDIHQVKGSGDNGRIIKRDIDNFTPAAQPAKAEARPGDKVPFPVATTTAGEEGYTDTPLSQMRKVIAQRLSQSMYSAPHFYLRMTVTMDAAIEARKAINIVSPVKVSFNDIIIKACAAALRRHPEVNSSWTGESIRTYKHIHVGTAVAVDEGLIVPVIKFADTKSLSQIAQEASGLYEKARNKKLQPPEFTGNTFTVSNLGMMDIDEFTAIINPPDSCILAIGKIAPTPVAEGDKVVIRQLLRLTLSCDHRVVDGAVGARFLQTLKSFLENPVTMLA